MLIKPKFLHNNKSSDISFPSFMKYFLPTAINIKYKQNFYIFTHILFHHFGGKLCISRNGYILQWYFNLNIWYYIQRVTPADGTAHNTILQNLMRNIYFMNNFNTIKYTLSPLFLSVRHSEENLSLGRKKQMLVLVTVTHLPGPLTLTRSLDSSYLSRKLRVDPNRGKIFCKM